jgi:hypothetical protein
MEIKYCLDHTGFFFFFKSKSKHTHDFRQAHHNIGESDAALRPLGRGQRGRHVLGRLGGGDADVLTDALNGGEACLCLRRVSVRSLYLSLKYYYRIEPQFYTQKQQCMILMASTSTNRRVVNWNMPAREIAYNSASEAKDVLMVP